MALALRRMAMPAAGLVSRAAAARLAPVLWAPPPLPAGIAARFASTQRRSKDPPSNERLVSSLKSVGTVMLVGDEGRIGEMSPAEALKHAKAERKDLIAVAMGASPPVLKLGSMGDLAQKESVKAAKLRAMQRSQKVKGMRFTCKIEEHDLANKTERVRKFLAKGHPVRVGVVFAPRSPRELQEPQRRAVMRRVLTEVEDVGVLEPAALRTSHNELFGVVVATPSGRPASDQRFEQTMGRLDSPIWPSGKDGPAAGAGAGAGAGADAASSFEDLDEEEDDDTPGEGAAEDAKPGKQAGARSRKPKGSPSASREQQDEWRRGVTRDTEVEAEVDEATDQREGDSWLRGRRGARAVAEAPVGSGRENSGGARRRGR